ncbi:hypothetical protein [Flavobacterium sp. 1355]|jgi:hypothetical protein|uniref:hypothetical protein n=1 Tax=Flavobacterium sp. 1355 TaxID=2806571 RepID=UPI001AE168E1|nr:hypothetical protein [Flavobacterium sp. 1355]MBP1222667.1 hypothetical protein [Flavobacterium sp. 1355]
MFFILLFIVIVGGCWKLGKAAGNSLFPDNYNRSGYVDKSTTIHHHHHYHDNRSIHVDGKNIKDLK